MDVSQEIGQVLDELSARFGTVGVELWAELVRYEIANVIASAVLCPLAAAISIIVCRWGFKKYAETDEEVYGGAILLGGIIALVLTVLTFVSLWDLTVTLAAPQAATLKGLLPR